MNNMRNMYDQKWEHYNILMWKSKEKWGVCDNEANVTTDHNF